MTIEKNSDFLDRCEAVVTAAISTASSTTYRCLSGGTGGVVVARLNDLFHIIILRELLESPLQYIGMGIALSGEHIARPHHIVVVLAWLVNNLVGCEFRLDDLLVVGVDAVLFLQLLILLRCLGVEL